jgi:hypothetical protein
MGHFLIAAAILTRKQSNENKTALEKINTIQIYLSQYQFGLEESTLFQYNLKAQWAIFWIPPTIIPTNHKKLNEEDSCIFGSYPTEIKRPWTRFWNRMEGQKPFQKKSNP